MQSPIIPVTITLAVLAAILGGFAIISEQTNAAFDTVEARLTILRDHIEALEQDLAFLLEDNEMLATALDEERERRESLEEQQTSFTNKFSTLEAGEATAIVSRWEPFVYKIICTFPPYNEQGRGSAIVEQVDNTLRFITNEHVLEEDGERPTVCTLSKPENESISVDIFRNTISVENNTDVGYGKFSAAIPALNKSKYCTEQPAIGDRIVTLGYPGIGASGSITATEGIISGIEDEYYVTSAKIESGNSGGAAIHVKNDCLIGLPTIVVRGKLESLARILPLDQITF